MRPRLSYRCGPPRRVGTPCVRPPGGATALDPQLTAHGARRIEERRPARGWPPRLPGAQAPPFAHFVVDTKSRARRYRCRGGPVRRELRAVAKDTAGGCVPPPEVRVAAVGGPAGPGGISPARLLTEAVVDGRLEISIAASRRAGARGPGTGALGRGGALRARGPGLALVPRPAGRRALHGRLRAFGSSRATTQDPSAIAGRALTPWSLRGRVSAWPRSECRPRAGRCIGERWGPDGPTSLAGYHLGAPGRSETRPARARSASHCPIRHAAALIGIATGSTPPDVPVEVESAVAALARIV